MKNIIKIFWKWIIQWIWIISVIFITGIVYAVNSWDNLTADMWNSLVSRVDNLENNNLIYYNSYLNVDRNTPQIVTTKDGNELGSDIIMHMFCWIQWTSWDWMVQWIIKKDYNWVKILKTASFSITSNTPEIFNDSWTIKIRLYAQMDHWYTVICSQKQLR